MSETFSKLDSHFKEFILEQKLFFVATALVNGDIALSAKNDTHFRIIDDQTVGYLDLSGGSNRTAIHLASNPRMTMLFISFSEEPMVLRLFGQGFVIRKEEETWDTYHSYFDYFTEGRQIILMKINAIETACGSGVPVFDFIKYR